MNLAEFVKDRDEALLSLDYDKIIAYGNKWGVNWGKMPKNNEGFWVSVHMARTALRSLPLEERMKSKQWLIERGYTPMDDGDLPAILSEEEK